MNARIAITGISLVNTLGAETAGMVAALRGPEGSGSGQDFYSVPTEVRAELPGVGWRFHTRAALLACVTGQRLLAQTPGLIAGPGLGLSLGWGMHQGLDIYEHFLQTLDPREVTPMSFLNLSPNVAASQLSIFLRIEGFTLTTATDYTAGLDALALAALSLRAGRGQAALAGGLEGDSPSVTAHFQQLDAQAEGAIRSSRPGQVVMGEGCGLMCLETEDAARARGAQALAWLEGIGQAAGPEAVAQALGQALEQAQLAPRAIDAVFTSASGLATADEAEARGLEQVFGEHRPPGVALKGVLGETLHAHGALSAGLAVLTLSQGFVPGTARCADNALSRRLRLSDRPRSLAAQHTAVIATGPNRKAAAAILTLTRS